MRCTAPYRYLVGPHQKVNSLNDSRSPSRLRFTTRFTRAAVRCALLCATLLLPCTIPSTNYASDIGTHATESTQPVTIAADWCSRWQQGTYDVYHLRGNCYINQGLTYARAPEAVLWVDHTGGTQKPTKVIAYLESSTGKQVVVDYQQATNNAVASKTLGKEQSSTWFERFYTTAPLVLKLPQSAPEPTTRPAIYDRGLAQFDPLRRRQLQLAQFTEFAPTVDPAQPLPTGMRRFQLSPRNNSSVNFNVRPQPNGENITVVSGGIRVLIEGLTADNLSEAVGPIGTIDISTDRVVIWHGGAELGLGSSTVQSQDTPTEIYMEGNIEFRQGDRTVYADRMFYDVRRQIGIILNAELLTPLPKTDDLDYQGKVRLRASAIRQLDKSHFSAINAQVTTSRFEEPSYHFAANEISFQDIQSQVFDPSTGQAVVQHQQMAESQGNWVYMGGLPVFYWPTIATDLRKPSFFIDGIRIGNDNVFGTQVLTDLDAYQLFGIRNAPQGTEWGLSLDYLSDRGFGHGTNFFYDRTEIFGHDGPAWGNWDFWGIQDTGLDNLGGIDRRTIVPEEDYRFRLAGQHRQRLQNGWEATGEVGWISDRTFLEQYYEREWDELKDARTGIRLKKLTNNRAFSIEANGQVNPFFTETQWLPRLDHYWLGESLFGDRITWFEHSQAAYANINIATTPTNPDLATQFTLLPWEETFPGSGIPISGKGERLVTRQEIDLPFSVGPVKVVPFALGELAHWGEALDGDDLQRAYMHTGVRTSMPMWAVYPNVRDRLFNLNGLAHKVVFESEFAYADSTRNYLSLPLYDPLDDTSILEMRRRLLDIDIDPTIDFITNPQLDPRTYAFRSGLQGWVTSPSTEIADDLMTLRFGMRNRWQTKRGAPGRQHIVDWLTIDSNVTWFPKADRDNFGQDFGLFDYDARWHLGDRFTVVSSGAADFFSDGLRTIAGGIFINRPSRGNAYIGVRSIHGPISSDVLLGSYSYRLSPKWISTAGASVDFNDTGNIGQSFSMTRIGESMLVTLGINVDSARDNVGFRFLIEPRFLPKLRLTSMTGIEVPPAGAFGLE